ncbi:hypothetical protein C8J56DRAFT_923457 [Mycena floridula]|nr:hypothetical protein C8J56DRAFT_923457 [Mycena floridula]
MQITAVFVALALISSISAIPLPSGDAMSGGQSSSSQYLPAVGSSSSSAPVTKKKPHLKPGTPEWEARRVRQKEEDRLRKQAVRAAGKSPEELKEINRRRRQRRTRLSEEVKEQQKSTAKLNRIIDEALLSPEERNARKEERKQYNAARYKAKKEGERENKGKKPEASGRSST